MSENMVEKMDLIEKVGEMRLMGKSTTDIAKELGIKRIQVEPFFREFQSLLAREASRGSLSDSLDDLLFESTQSMRLLLERLWAEYHEAKANLNDKLALDALKEIRTLTGQRHKMIQESGFEAEAFAAEMEETARQHEILIGLLKEIKDEFPEVAQIISTRISQVTNEVQVIEMEREEDV